MHSASLVVSPQLDFRARYRLDDSNTSTLAFRSIFLCMRVHELGLHESTLLTYEHHVEASPLHGTSFKITGMESPYLSIAIRLARLIFGI